MSEANELTKKTLLEELDELEDLVKEKLEQRQEVQVESEDKELKAKLVELEGKVQAIKEKNQGAHDAITQIIWELESMLTEPEEEQQQEEEECQQ